MPSRPGASTTKSINSVSPAGVWTIMKPPAPKPVRGLSSANDASTAQTAASTALPPSRSTPAPASAVRGWPAATTPFMGCPYSAGQELGDVYSQVATSPRLGRATPTAFLGAADGRLGGAARGLWASVEAGGDDGDPDLVGELVVDVGAEDDVGVGMGGLAHHLGRLADLDQGEVGAAGDREQDRAGALHRGLQQRRGDRFFGGLHRPGLAMGHADAEQGTAG